MANINNIPLVSSEIAGLWYSYMGDSMAVCMLRYFQNRTDDNQVLPMIQHSLNLSEQHIEFLTKIMNQENLPIPLGFNENDVDVNAPRLFSDTFYLQYLTYMARVGMHNYTLILNHTSRSDIRHYFTNCLYESAQLYNMLADLRLEKGLFIKAPTVEVPKEVSFVKSSSFMTDFFGEKRPLINREITHMFAIILANIIGKALVTGFGQVAKRKTVSDYFFKGSELASELIGSISSIHIEEGIPIPSTSDSFVTDSTISPFSDKLMMNHITAMNSMSLSGLGIALAESMRTDLQVTYGRFVAKVFNYAKEGADIMIEENWMEQPPQAINHKNLGKHK